MKKSAWSKRNQREIAIARRVINGEDPRDVRKEIITAERTERQKLQEIQRQLMMLEGKQAAQEKVAKQQKNKLSSLKVLARMKIMARKLGIEQYHNEAPSQ
ncbi:MAG: hypothetical protein JSS89_13195 [Bacteroidetes bacterium]|nr:hypothetical protein [Bacteroidota bacterium]